MDLCSYLCVVTHDRNDNICWNDEIQMKGIVLQGCN